MKKAEVIKKLGGVRATARALGLSSAAVSLWGKNIPELRAYQLREKFPELFSAQKPAPPKQAD